MTWAEEKLARLNPKTVRFDVGAGGTPEFDPTDFAAALAFVPQGIGRELLIARAWPDGADVQKIVRLGCEIGVDELRRQHDARIRRGIEHCIAGWGRKPPTTPAPSGWPACTHDRLPAIALAAALEVVADSHCPRCAGRGTVMRDALAIICTDCRGSGFAAVSDAERARRIGVTRQSYASSGWAAPLNHLLSRMRDEYYAARRALTDALR